MNNTTEHRIAVCSWSLQPATPRELVDKLRQAGIKKVQLAFDPLRESPAIWDETMDLFAREGVTMVSGMFGCVGEDYSTLESIRRTGGIAPDHTWEQNLKNATATALLARKLGVRLVGFHAGFIPHDTADPGYQKMIDRLLQVAAVFEAENVTLALETGQETAQDLLRVLESLKRPNVVVNFDPANMLLYDKGDPIESLRLLGTWVRQVHVKDATRTTLAGTWGAEVPVGTGQVNWPAFFQVLKQNGYKGNLVIEREAGDQRVEDIRTAKQLLLSKANLD